MGGGPCGVDCSVCRLHVMGICSRCGPGTSDAGKAKLGAQKRMMGVGCPMLECAVDKGIPYCMRDCDEFPCEKFERAGFPYSTMYLDMHKRRLEEAGPKPVAAWPETSEQFWERLGARDPNELIRVAGVAPDQRGRFTLQSLQETWSIDPKEKTIEKSRGNFGGEWDRQIPFLMLIYLATVTHDAMTTQMVAPAELYPGANAFSGNYRLDTKAVESGFGNDSERFREIVHYLGGKEIEGADVAGRFHIFPKLPVDYLLWLADDEFPARLTVLFDKGTGTYIGPDVVSKAVNLFTERMVRTAADRM